MSLTGRSATDVATPEALVAERIELMSLLWQILDGDTAYSANPRLLMVAKLVPELRDVPAAAALGALRTTLSRDQLIKGLASSAHGQPVSPGIAELATAIDALSDQWDDLLEALAPPLTAAYRTMRDRADPLAARLDPAADLAAITGERDSLRVAVLPSLFLPPPQNGRHSALVAPPGEEAIGYLHYGYPLDDDPAQFGISAYWLLGGAWHYAAHRFIERHWPAIADELRAMPDLENILTEALAEHRETVVWPNVIAEHVSIALKCVLCQQVRMPDLIHRAFARTQGLAFFAWFKAWLSDLSRDPETFVARFRRLPQMLAERRDELVAVAAATPSGPASINFALASRQPRVIVLPDHWDDALIERIGRRWSLVTASLLRESEWRNGADRPPASVIAFGEVGRDGLAGDLLTGRGLTLDPSDEGGEVLVSLFPPERARKPWQLAVAVHDPEVAGNFAAEHVVSLFHGTARFAGYRFGDGMLAG